jgi:hypothetical protein
MALTLLQAADVWIAAGGPRSRAAEFVAIGMGESSLEPSAQSPAGAQGIWQVMPFWWPQLGLNPAMWDDPLTNARAAVAISGHGTNCAAWDSAYRNIYASGRYPFLGWPEPGSVDYANLLHVSVALGHDKLGGAVPPGGFTPGPAVVHALSQIQLITGKLLPALERQMLVQRMSYQSMFRPGWRK